MTLTRPLESGSAGSGLSERIPAERYTSREFLALEAEKLWPKVWQIACREEDLSSVGDFFEYNILDQSILLVRDTSDTIKAYFNACLHRGTQLKKGCGSAKELRCPFHGWRWGLDGAIKEVQDAFDFDPDCIQAERLQLPECLVDTWGGFVFINMDPDAAPLLDYLGPIPGRLGRFETEKMRYVRCRSTVAPANWKVALDAFNENYHAAATHPQSLQYFDDTTEIYERHGIHSVFCPGPNSFGSPSPRLGYQPEAREILLSMLDDLVGILFNQEELDAISQMVEAVEIPEDQPLQLFLANMRRMMAQAENVDLSGFTDDQILLGEDWNIFPNISTPVNGANAFVFRFRPNGFDPDTCLMDVWTLQRVPDGQAVQPVEREFYADSQAHDWGRILSQDFSNMQRVQEGLHSKRLRHVIFGRQETCVRNFHQAVMSYLAR